MDIRDMKKSDLLDDMETIKFYTDFYIYDNDLNKHLKKLNKAISSIEDDNIEKIISRKEID